MPDRRPLTAVIRRRAWGELGVRPWTFLTILLALASLSVAYFRFTDWRYEKRIIESGTPVQAEVTVIGMGDLAKQGSRDETLNVELRYTPPESTSPLASRNTLPRKPGEVVKLKDILRVNIDPQRPEYWTERTQPQPLGLVMITPLLTGGVALLCGLLAFAKRNRVLRAYRQAEPRRATVVSVRQSPLAPFSKIVAVSLDEGDDRRVRDCYWPTATGPVHPKQPIEVLIHRRHTFAAAAYGQAPAVLPGQVLES